MNIVPDEIRHLKTESKYVSMQKLSEKPKDPLPIEALVINQQRSLENKPVSQITPDKQKILNAVSLICSQ